LVLCILAAILCLTGLRLRTQKTPAPNVSLPVQSLAREARAQFELGKFAEAEQTYRNILEEAPNNLDALSNLGVVLFRAGKLPPAEDALKKAIAVAPKDGFSHRTLGIVYYSQAKYDEAINALTKAIALNPRDAVAHNYLGITAAQKGWLGAAQKEFETAGELDPNFKAAPSPTPSGDFLTPLEKTRFQLPPEARR